MKIMTHLMKVSMATAFSPLLRGAGAWCCQEFPPVPSSQGRAGQAPPVCDVLSQSRSKATLVSSG